MPIGSQNGVAVLGLSDKAVPYPGLTASSAKIPKLYRDVAKRQAALIYKQSRDCLWVVFLGGTGTGKSTLFNAFCGQPISDTGVERPKTSGPILYADVRCSVPSGFPMKGIAIEERRWQESDANMAKGHADRLLLFTHQEDTQCPLVVVDTPDLDSVEGIHRDIAEDFFLLADAVVFVASQEKYADEIPCRFLAKVIEEKRPLFFLLNKVQEPLVKEEILATLKGHGISLSRTRIWLIPHDGAQPAPPISQQESFQAFVDTLFDDISSGEAEAFKNALIAQRTEDLAKRARHLSHLLEEELGKSQQWFEDLSVLCSRISVSLLEEEKHRFLTQSAGVIQREVKKLFYKYDVLAKPRRFVRSILRTPLEVIGVLRARTQSSQKKALSKVRGKIVFVPILRAVDHFNRQALDLLSPKDPESPLFRGLRQAHIIMTEDEIRASILKEQDVLDRWLGDRFERLAHDLPKRKKWGIYSTSVLWGVLILSFEVIVGGGFTVLDAALDSVIAPFVTKGTVELFASREIRKIARELAQRYEEGLLSVIVEQKNRYQNCLKALLPPEETMEALRTL